MQEYKQLKKIFKKQAHLQYIQKIMMWDESVVMPVGAGAYRANAVATLERMTQQVLARKNVQALIENTERNGQDFSPWDKANFIWMKKKYQQAAAIPLKLTEELTKTKIGCEQAWRQYRQQNDWQAFLPYLENTFQLVKEAAERQGQLLGLAPYEVLLDEYAPGFTQKSIDHIFAELKQTLPPLIKKIIAKQATEKVEIPQGPFSQEKQKEIGLEVMKALEFNFQQGRLDASHHPFCNGISKDIRITTRYSETEFITSLLGICHETGHALYEQGLPAKWISQPVGMVHSMAMHESQSLLVEMEVCRSPAYFEFVLPLIQKQFGKQAALTADNLFKLITRVKPSFIRVDADEVTYPMHVILRYEIEKALFNGELKIKDLPHHWNELMLKYLGLSTLDNHKNGAMQDVHWPAGMFGYFPAYTLGRMIAAQFFSSFAGTNPGFPAEIEKGNFKPLVTWLRTNIHANASLYTTSELLKKVSGNDLETSHFIKHLEQRYL